MSGIWRGLVKGGEKVAEEGFEFGTRSAGKVSKSITKAAFKNSIGEASTEAASGESKAISRSIKQTRVPKITHEEPPAVREKAPTVNNNFKKMDWKTAGVLTAGGLGGGYLLHQTLKSDVQEATHAVGSGVSQLVNDFKDDFKHLPVPHLPAMPHPHLPAGLTNLTHSIGDELSGGFGTGITILTVVVGVFATYEIWKRI